MLPPLPFPGDKPGTVARMFALAVLVGLCAALLACHGPSDGVTFCGVELRDAEPSDVRKLQRAEFLSLTAIEDAAKRKDGSPLQGFDVCSSLRGLRLYLRPEPWASVTCDCEVPPMVCGSTHLRPDGDWMELVWPMPSGVEGCLAHELEHYAQAKLEWEHEPHHDSWTARGYYAAETLAGERIREAGL